jgi:hypothetical protein
MPRQAQLTLTERIMIACLFPTLHERCDFPDTVRHTSEGILDRAMVGFA